MEPDYGPTVRVVEGRHGMHSVFVGGLKRGFITRLPKQGNKRERWVFDGVVYPNRRRCLQGFLDAHDLTGFSTFRKIGQQQRMG